MLYAVAGLLAAVGAGFLIAAFVTFQDNETLPASSGPVATATTTATSTEAPASDVQGVQSTPTPEATATIPVATPEEQATAAPTATNTEVPAPTSPPAPTATAAPAATAPPPQPVLDPTEPITVEPTPVPTGPLVGIEGPTSVGIGESAHFSARVDPEPLTVVWRYGGQETAHARFIDVAWQGTGCFVVQLEAIYSDGTTKTVSRNVAVGPVSCP